MLEHVLTERKRETDPVRVQALKIILVSVYGSFGS